MNTVEDRVRAVIGDLTLNLIMAQHRVGELEQLLAAKEAELAAAQPPAKPNGKAAAGEVKGAPA